MARVPGGFGINDVMGVRRPSRAVSLERPVGSAWIEALLAQAERGDPDTPRQPPGPTVPGWASNVVNSTLGGILGQGSLAGQQRAGAEWMAQGLSLPTPGGAMRQEGTADVIDTVLNLVRPLALADVGVAGSAGSMMFPFPGLAPGAAPAAGAARRAGGGMAGALSRLLGRGADEAAPVVAREATEAAGWGKWLTQQPDGQANVPVGGLRLIMGHQLNRHVPRRLARQNVLSDGGDITVSWIPEQRALTTGEVRSSLRELEGIVRSMVDEGFNIWAKPASPQLGRFYRTAGFQPASGKARDLEGLHYLPGNRGGAG